MTIFAEKYNDFCRKIWWSLRKIWRFLIENLTICARWSENFCRRKMWRFFQEKLTISRGKFDALHRKILTIFVRKFDSFCKKIWQFLQKNIMIFVGKLSKIGKKKYKSCHRGSNLSPQEQTTDKKLLQIVNGRMKRNRIDYCIKICGKID